MKNAFGITKKTLHPAFALRDEAPLKIQLRSTVPPELRAFLRATRCAVTGAPGRGSPLHSAVVEVRHMAGCLQRVLPDGSPLCGMENGTSVCPHHRFGTFDFDAPAAENLRTLRITG